MTNIPLKHPFTSADGKRIESVDMRRATRGDLKLSQRHSKDAIDAEDFLFTRLTGLVVEDLDRLDIEDATALQDAFRDQQGKRAEPAASGRNTAEGAEDPAV